MTNDEINRYIHIEIMGQPCWHEWGPAEIAQIGGVVVLCKKCKVGRDGDMEGHFNPDYCSDDSPRSLLRGVVAKLLAGDANGEIERALDRKMVFARSRNADTDPRWSCPYLATAEQIAIACVEAHKTVQP